MAMKQMEPTVAKVGDNKFYITPFPAFKAANLTGELASTLAPLLGVLTPLVNDESDGLMNMDVSVAAQAMAGCSALSGDKLEILMRKLLLGGHIVVEIENENGEIEPERLDMDIANELFCGEVQDMFILCFHVIKLNFNGFFKRLANPSGKVELAQAEEKTPRKIL